MMDPSPKFANPLSRDAFSFCFRFPIMRLIFSSLYLLPFLCLGVLSKDPNLLESRLKVLFVLGRTTDNPWDFHVEVGRQVAAANLEDKVTTSVLIPYDWETMFHHELPRALKTKQRDDDASTRDFFASAEDLVTNEWDPEELLREVEEFISDGYQMVFFTSPEFANTSETLAEKYPKISFILMPTILYQNNRSNIHQIETLIYQASYLAGILAGDMTNTNKLGFLHGPSLANERATNSFCLGARTVNPDVECLVIVIPQFDDVRLLSQSTERLLAMGVDSLFGVTGSLIPLHLIRDLKNIYGTGFTSDSRALFGSNVLTSVIFNWGGLFSDIIRRYIEGEELEVRILAGLNSFDCIDVAPLSELVNQDIVPFFESERERIRSSAVGEEVIFCGEDALEGLIPESVPEIDPDTGCVNVFTDLHYLGYVREIPEDFYRNDVYLKSSSGVYVGLMVVNGVATGLSFLYFFLFLYFSSTPVIRYASPMFCLVIFVGAWMQLGAAFTYLQKPSGAVCMTSVWLEIFGFTMMLCAIVVKNFRLWRLFKKTEKFFPTAIPPHQLFIAIGLGSLGMLIILAAWQATDPYVASNAADHHLRLDEEYLYCGGTNEGLWVGVVWGYLSIWIIAGLVLAYQTRRLHGFLCETTEISASLYNIAIVELIFLPLIYTTELDHYDTRTILLTCPIDVSGHCHPLLPLRP